jgi:spore coat protein U-like protein
MNMKQTFGVLALTSLVTCIPGAIAATQGNLGADSAGSAVISLVKGFGLRISDIDDVNFGATTTQPANQLEDVCVYSTNGNYRITAASANGTGNQFRMLGQTAFNYLVYDLAWTANTSATTGVDLNNNALSGVINGANSVLQDCNGVPSARMIVNVNNASFNAAAQDTYRDTLNLTVEPE